jgi:hypothetical protein
MPTVWRRSERAPRGIGFAEIEGEGKNAQRNQDILK